MPSPTCITASCCSAKNKDDLLQEYGLLRCAETDLACRPRAVPSTPDAGRSAAKRWSRTAPPAHTALPDAVCDSASIDDIMRFYSGRDAQ